MAGGSLNVFKKYERKFQKPLDNLFRLWYNKYVIKRENTDRKKIKKKFKKGLDKLN